MPRSVLRFVLAGALVVLAFAVVAVWRQPEQFLVLVPSSEEQQRCRDEEGGRGPGQDGRRPLRRRAADGTETASRASTRTSICR